MSALNILRDALFGNPPSPDFKPSREGVLAAFQQMQLRIDSTLIGINSYALVADLPAGADDGSQARVFDDPTPANNTYWIKIDGVWEIDADLIASIAAIVQPLVDDAETARDDAQTAATTATGAVQGVTDVSGPIYDAFVGDDAQVFARGSFFIGGTTINSGLKGWRAPFKHNGEPFICGQFNVKGSHAETRGMIRILDASLVELARGNFVVGTVNETITFLLTSYVRTLAANAIGYIEYTPITAGQYLGYPGGNGGSNLYPVGDADPATYREQYLNGSDVWTNASPAGSYCIPFRLFDLQGAYDTGLIPALVAQLAALNTLVSAGDTVQWEQPGFTGYDTVYTQAGVGTSTAVFTEAVSFNEVTIHGGIAGEGELRGYLVPAGATVSRVPSATGILLFSHDVDWTVDVASRRERLGETYSTIPGYQLDLLWRSKTSGQTVSAARFTVDPGALAPVLRISTTGAGLASIWDASWGPGTRSYTTAPPILSLSLATRPDSEIAAVAADEFRLQSPVTGTGYLRKTRAKAAALDTVPSIPSRLILAIGGDSWVAGVDYFLKGLASRLVKKFGDGGVGYVQFGYTGSSFQDARGLYTVSRSGTWTTAYNVGSVGPSIGDARSSVAGSKITIANVAAATHPGFSGALLHFTGTADGVIRWRWNGGAWSANTNVQGGVGTQQTLALTGFPTGALATSAVNTNVLEIENVSGSIIVCGVDLQSSTDGVVIHNLGASGSRATNWVTAMTAQWRAGFAALNADGFIYITGTNDQNSAVTLAQFQTYLETIAANARLASPNIDVLLSVSPENNAGLAMKMKNLQASGHKAATNANTAFCNLQGFFGDPDTPSEYQVGTGIGLLLNANPHPTGYASAAISGGQILSAAIYDTLLVR